MSARLHQCHVEDAAIIPILPIPGACWLPWGLSYCLFNITLRKHSRGKHTFFSPFSVFKSASSWEAGPLCCWAFSCLWRRERGLEQGGEQRGQMAAGRGHLTARHPALSTLQPC